MLVPPAHLNETAKIVEAEMIARMSKLKERIESGTIQENTDGELAYGVSYKLC